MSQHATYAECGAKFSIGYSEWGEMFQCPECDATYEMPLSEAEVKEEAPASGPIKSFRERAASRKLCVRSNSNRGSTWTG